jgi:hypothetical protein
VAVAAACNSSKPQAGSDKAPSPTGPGVTAPVSAPAGGCPTTGATTLATSPRILPIGIAVTESRVFWASDKGIETVPLGEGISGLKEEAKTIASTEGDPPVAIVADNATVFWLTVSGKWNHAPAYGGPVKTEWTGDLGMMPRALNSYGFFVERGGDVVLLQAGVLQGQAGSLSEIAKGPEKGRGLGMVNDPNHVFWLVESERGDKVILLSAGLHGGDVKTLATLDGVSGALAMDSQGLVVTVTRAMGAGSVYRVTLDGKSTELLAKQDQMLGVATTGKFIYTNPYKDGKTTLRRIPGRDGGVQTPADMFCGDGKMLGLGLVPGTGGSVFFALQPEGKPGSIMKIKKE